jgi:hypothetical protein
MKMWDIRAIFLSDNRTIFVPATFTLTAFSARENKTLSFPNTPEQKRDQADSPAGSDFHQPRVAPALV